MKKSREVLVFAALLATALVVPNLSAQDTTTTARPPRGDRGAHAGKAAEALGLTDEQKTQLKAIGDEQRTAAEAIRNDASLTKEQKRDQLQTLRQGFADRRKTVLTPEQQAKAAEFRQNRGDRPGRAGGQGGQGGEGRRPRRGGGGGGE